MEDEQRLIYGVDEVDKAAAWVVAQFDRCAVVTLTGTLGAGKTTLMQAILRRCGIEEPITSPTFTYVNEYRNKQGTLFYHFDLYRLSGLEEFLGLGFEEYLYKKKCWTFIEWPEVVMPLLTHRVCHITLDYYELDKRVLCAQIIDNKS